MIKKSTLDFNSQNAAIRVYNNLNIENSTLKGYGKEYYLYVSDEVMNSTVGDIIISNSNYYLFKCTNIIYSFPLTLKLYEELQQNSKLNEINL